jgi:hypothetical protein
MGLWRTVMEWACVMSIEAKVDKSHINVRYCTRKQSMVLSWQDEARLVCEGYEGVDVKGGLVIKGGAPGH